MTNKVSYGLGTVNGVQGLIILPDDWNGSVMKSTEFKYGSTSFIDNTFDETDSTTKPKWSEMESAGCVFLPCAGYRDVSTVRNVSSDGCYWSSSAHVSGPSNAYNVYFIASGIYPQLSNSRYRGRAVRLVCVSE